MKGTRRNKKNAVASVSPDISLIVEDKNISTKTERPVAIIGEADDEVGNDQASSQKENQEETVGKPSTPSRKNSNVPKVTPQKPEDQKPNKSPRKGPFGRKILDEDVVVLKPAIDVPALVKIVYRCRFCDRIFCVK